MAVSVTALPAGRRTSSPARRPISPTNSPFLPSSSQQSGLATASNDFNKTAGRFSDAFSAIVGRNRTLSADSNSRDLPYPGRLQTQVQEGHAIESSFGIGELLSSFPTGFLHPRHGAILFRHPRISESFWSDTQDVFFSKRFIYHWSGCSGNLSPFFTCIISLRQLEM